MKRYETPQALRRALEDRLLAQVRREGGDIQRLRRQTAFDRLLCRLFHETSAPLWVAEIRSRPEIIDLQGFVGNVWWYV
jgi:hypothetical protein